MTENPIFSYTRRDYEGSRQEGIAKIPLLSKGQWTDLNATDPGIIILDYVHALVDMLNYYQDHQALEAFLSTAKERANIFRLAKQLCYNIISAKGAICEVEFTSSMIYDYTVRIPKHTVVATLSGTQYLTSQDAYLLPGETRVSVPCSQGKLSTFTYEGTGISRFSNVLRAANQTVRLVDNNIDIDSITITDNIGRTWTPVDYIIFSTELDRVYQIELNPDNSITISFGDGQRGIVPRESDVLTISYITTSAEEGRVGENTLTVLGTPITNDQGDYLAFTVNNLQASTGGSTVQSSQEIKELAPGAIKAQDRAVTLSDFENLAKLVDGVADAKAYDINIAPDLCLYHEVKVLITPESSDDSVELLQSRVYNFLSQRMIPPTNLQVFTPSYTYVDISITIRKLDNITDGRLSYAVQQAVAEFFNNRVSQIGETFYPVDLTSIVSNIEGVRNIVSITPSEAITAGSTSVIRLGSLDIKIV